MKRTNKLDEVLCDQKIWKGGFPGGPVAKTLPSTGGASLIPGQGTKVLHVAKN